MSPMPVVAAVPDYLGYSIFTMLCCCLPLGIVATIFSCNVSLHSSRTFSASNLLLYAVLNFISSIFIPCVIPFYYTLLNFLISICFVFFLCMDYLGCY
uniref:Uncharacterized protein n=1 Tax=Cyprinus carpio TaxID=7962 RepID=A0A8C1X2Z5_CYPCA